MLFAERTEVREPGAASATSIKMPFCQNLNRGVWVFGRLGFWAFVICESAQLPMLPLFAWQVSRKSGGRFYACSLEFDRLRNELDAVRQWAADHTPVGYAALGGAALPAPLSCHARALFFLLQGRQWGYPLRVLLAALPTGHTPSARPCRKPIRSAAHVRRRTLARMC